MATLLLWAAKRAVILRIKDQSSTALPGDTLYGIEVDYALPATPERISVYGGRCRSIRAQAGGEHGLLFREDLTIEVRVRVQELGDDINHAEMTAESICQAIALAVSAEPRLVPSGLVAVTATDQDPTAVFSAPEPMVTVNVSLTVSISVNSVGV